VVSFVVPGGALTAETLDITAGRAAISRASSGRAASFRRRDPKTASGKILRRLLRDGQYTEVRP